MNTAAIIFALAEFGLVANLLTYLYLGYRWYVVLGWLGAIVVAWRYRKLVIA